MVLIQELPTSAILHYERSLILKAAFVRDMRRAWRRIEPSRVRDSWAEILHGMKPRIYDFQYAVAVEGASYSGRSLAERGGFESASVFVDPMGFVGTSHEGRSLDAYFMGAAYSTLDDLAGGMEVHTALSKGGKKLDMLGALMMTGIGSQAASVDVASRPMVGYVRMVNPPSCKDCVVLAGNFYRWNAGFLRHPNCDCVHVPSKKAQAEGMLADPYEYFNGLTVEEQDKLFGAGGAQAIRDGADIYQVYNSSSGRARFKVDGFYTTAGTSRRGYASQVLQPGQRRLTPEGVYAEAQRLGWSREETLEALSAHGYILPGGQNPHGSIAGIRYRDRLRRSEVFYASQGRSYMTAAEKRYEDAIWRYEQVQLGNNPYSSAALVRRQQERGDNVRQWSPDSPLTDEIRARVEAEYYAVLTTKGEMFTKSGQSLSRNLRANREYYNDLYGVGR